MGSLKNCLLLRKRHILALLLLIFCLLLLDQTLTYHESFRKIRNFRAAESSPLIDEQDNEKIIEAAQLVESSGGSDEIGRTGSSISNNETVNNVFPVLVIACDRVSVRQHLQQLLKHRDTADSQLPDFRFPIIVSQDCDHEPTKQVILDFQPLITLIEQPDQGEIPGVSQRKLLGYYKIARHYKWALDQIFMNFNYSKVIITEDDLNIAPDFYEYFAATYRLLVSDQTLWCVSAWNDNGKDGLVMPDKRDLLHRTDFFPGLGWMLLRETWLELRPKWPTAFWDDWMRQPEQRRGRACIRPEISRTTTFGQLGISKGQHYSQHFQYLRLNHFYIPFTQLNLSYLEKANYDDQFEQRVKKSPVVTVMDLISQNFSEDPEAVRLTYANAAEFKTIANAFRLMDDLKSGVMRTAYRGILSFSHLGRRVYIAPAFNWTDYDTKLKS